MARIEYPSGNTKANPLIVVEPDEVVAWLRGLADDLGFADRETSAVQVSFPMATSQPDPEYIHSPPEIVFMVSGIPNSRNQK